MRLARAFGDACEFRDSLSRLPRKLAWPTGGLERKAMESILFSLAAVMLAGYLVLDGFDVGVGILHSWLARSEADRRAMLHSIGPAWDGKELWLLAAAGTLCVAFPALYTKGLSGFDLPLIVLLSLLVIRGISLGFRNHVRRPARSRLWDIAFGVTSILLALSYGVALGNVVRGVPLNAAGHFVEPLWTNFQPVGHTGILDWYTVLVGVVALAALALHGASWLAMKMKGELRTRVRKYASALWWMALALTALITFISFQLLPQLALSFHDRPWGIVFPVLALTGLFGIKWYDHIKHEAMAFRSSCAYLIGMLASVAFSLYPNVLPSSLSPFQALTVVNSKGSVHELKIGLLWWVIGMALAYGYIIHRYRSFGGRLSLRDAHAKKSDERDRFVSASR